MGALVAALVDGRPDEAEEALVRLRQCGDEGFEELAKRATSVKAKRRADAITALGRVGWQDGFPLIIGGLEDGSSRVRGAARDAALAVGPAMAQALREALDSPNEKTRSVVAEFLNDPNTHAEFPVDLSPPPDRHDTIPAPEPPETSAAPVDGAAEGVPEASPSRDEEGTASQDREAHTDPERLDARSSDVAQAPASVDTAAARGDRPRESEMADTPAEPDPHKPAPLAADENAVLAAPVTATNPVAAIEGDAHPKPDLSASAPASDDADDGGLQAQEAALLAAVLSPEVAPPPAPLAATASDPAVEPSKPPPIIAETPLAVPDVADAPVAAPVEEPVVALVEPPIAAPVEEPVSVPIEEPVAAVVDEPIAAPVEEPVVASVEPPIAAPVEEPVSVPVEEPVAAVVDEPIAAPVEEPVSVPVDEPIAAPVAQAAPAHESVGDPVLVARVATALKDAEMPFAVSLLRQLWDEGSVEAAKVVAQHYAHHMDSPCWNSPELVARAEALLPSLQSLAADAYPRIAMAAQALIDHLLIAQDEHRSRSDDAAEADDALAGDAAEALFAALRDRSDTDAPDWLAGAVSLLRSDDPSILAQVLELLEGTTDEDVLNAVTGCLGVEGFGVAGRSERVLSVGGETAAQCLVARAATGSERERAGAARALVALGDDALNALTLGLTHGTSAEKQTLLAIVGRTECRQKTDLLVEALGSSDAAVRRAAADAMIGAEDVRVFEAFMGLENAGEALRDGLAMVTAADPNARHAALERARDANPATRLAAVEILAMAPHEDAVATLFQRLNDAVPGMSRAALTALAAIATPKVFEELVELVPSQDAELHSLIIMKLNENGEQSLPALVRAISVARPDRAEQLEAIAEGIVGTAPGALDALLADDDARVREIAQKLCTKGA